MLSKWIQLVFALAWLISQISLKYLNHADSVFSFARWMRDISAISLSLFALAYMVFQIRLRGWQKVLLWYGLLFLLIQGMFATSMLLQRSVSKKLRDKALEMETSFEISLHKVEAENRPQKETSQMREKLKDLIYEAKKTKTSWANSILELDSALTISGSILLLTIVISLAYPLGWLPKSLRRIE